MIQPRLSPERDHLFLIARKISADQPVPPSTRHVRQDDKLSKTIGVKEASRKGKRKEGDYPKPIYHPRISDLRRSDGAGALEGTKGQVT